MTGAISIPIDTAIFPAGEWAGQTESTELVRATSRACWPGSPRWCAGKA